MRSCVNNNLNNIKMKSNTGQTIRRLKAENKQLRIAVVNNPRELLIAYEVKKHPFLADKYKLEYATKLVDEYLKSN